MKKALITIAVTVLFAVGASAQVAPPVSCYLGGALSMPSSSDFNTGWQMGYHGWAGVGYKLMPNLQVAGKIEYHDFFFDLGDFVGLEGGDTKVWMYGLDGRYTVAVPTFPLKPFFMAGTGIARVSWDEFEGTSLIASTLNTAIPDPVSKMYINFGGGLELKASPAFSLFIQGRYVSVATEGARTDFIPVSIGLKFF